MLDTGAHIRTLGKGRKERATPLTKQTVAVLKAWLREIPDRDDATVFPSARGEPLSADGVQYLLAKHVAAASRTCPSLQRQTDHATHASPHHRHGTAAGGDGSGGDRIVARARIGRNDANLPRCEPRHERASYSPKSCRPRASLGRYRPDDQLLAFLKGL